MLRPNTFVDAAAAARTGGAWPVTTRRQALAADLVKGAIAGAAATWFMNRVTTVMYEHESPAARAREMQARGGQSALENAAERLAAVARIELDDSRKRAVASVMHVATGIAAGAAYAVARRRWPAVARAGGLPFGIGFFLLVDEAVNTALGFTPGPRTFPWQAHARGAAGHVAFGMVTHAVVAALDRVGPRGTDRLEVRLSTL